MGFASQQVLPTKINLIRLRRELKGLRRIRRVLEEKRDVLLLFIRQMIEKYEETYRKVAEILMQAYDEFLAAVAESGFETIRGIALTTPTTTTIDIKTRVLFAVKAPSYTLVRETVPTLIVGTTRVSPRLSSAQEKLVGGLEALLKLAETEATLEKLLSELKETQRLLNALDYMIIPRYESAIKFIRRVLDDRMREEILRIKMLKRILERRRASSR
ncbi:MAG TPA: V-type ATP synthase subunit D [Pyrodictium sp.]|nr:V-type ATP synthase subunit D [Pyrodictium sp.]